MSASGPIVMITDDPELLERLLSITAAVEVDPLVFRHPADLRSSWASAAMVLIGVDQAPAVAAKGLPRRGEVYLVGDETSSAAMPEAARWSTPLGAAVVPLPGSAGWLAGAITDLSGPQARAGRLVAIVGGSGGTGVSTLAATVAGLAARDAHRTLLIDTDVRGGGIDLLLGAEHVDGWRWPRLAAARGHLGDLSDQLPLVDGVHVLAMGRGTAPIGWELAAEQLTAVLRSARRSHDRIVVDVSRDLSAAVWAAIEDAGQIIVLASGHVRGVAAARELVLSRDLAADRSDLVVRTGRLRPLPPGVVADTIGLPLIGVVPDEPGIALGAERGDPPGRGARTPLAEAGRSILDRVAADLVLS